MNWHKNIFPPVLFEYCHTDPCTASWSTYSDAVTKWIIFGFGLEFSGPLSYQTLRTPANVHKEQQTLRPETLYKLCWRVGVIVRRFFYFYCVFWTICWLMSAGEVFFFFFKYNFCLNFHHPSCAAQKKKLRTSQTCVGLWIKYEGWSMVWS